jgi:plasmid stabilization system protein ParE
VSLPLIINPLAEGDLAEAQLWYEAQREGLGGEFLACVEAALDSIQRLPETPAKLYHDIRRVLIRRFPYGIFYRVDENKITVIAVYHARRDPRGWHERP